MISPPLEMGVDPLNTADWRVGSSSKIRGLKKPETLLP